MAKGTPTYLTTLRRAKVALEQFEQEMRDQTPDQQQVDAWLLLEKNYRRAQKNHQRVQRLLKALGTQRKQVSYKALRRAELAEWLTEYLVIHGPSPLLNVQAAGYAKNYNCWEIGKAMEDMGIPLKSFGLLHLPDPVLKLISRG